MKQRITFGILLTIIGIISLTLGTSFSFFDYAQQDVSDHIISSGKLAFQYVDTLGIGNEISITDATPKTDELGKIQAEDGEYFDFKITSNVSNNYDIPYEITARKNGNSTISENAIKVYLTELNGSHEDELLLNTYQQLNQTDKIDENKYIEKVIYQGEIPKNQNLYEKKFRLRVWVDQDYLSSSQTFSITINVYSNGTVVMSDEENTQKNNQNIVETLPTVEPSVDNSQSNNVPEIPDVSDTPDNFQPAPSPSPEVNNPPENHSSTQGNSDSNIRMNLETKKLYKHPKWGTIWATLKIPDIGLEAPIYHGDTPEMIDAGIGHYAGSYFPGEGASVIFASHNSKEHFMYLPQLHVGSQVIVEAVYGTLVYEVTSTKIIQDTDTASLPIQTDEEILMMYTCYPMGTNEYKVQRYVVYSKLVSESYY